MDFVAAAANLRAITFGIPQKSRFDIKCELIEIYIHVTVLSFRVFVILDYFKPNLVEGAKILINNKKTVYFQVGTHTYVL